MLTIDASIDEDAVDALIIETETSEDADNVSFITESR